VERSSVLIEAAGLDGFGEAGDSGALVVDRQARAIIGLHLGERRRVEIAGARHPRLAHAQPIGELLTLFDLEPL
jgi:hypothetical protein